MKKNAYLVLILTLAFLITTSGCFSYAMAKDTTTTQITSAATTTTFVPTETAAITTPSPTPVTMEVVVMLPVPATYASLFDGTKIYSNGSRTVVLKTLVKGDQVTITGTSGQYGVTADGAYINLHLMSIVITVTPTPAETTAETTAAPTDSTAATTKATTALTGTTAGEIPYQLMAYVHRDVVNLYAGPGTEYQIVSTISYGYSIELVAITKEPNSGWCRTAAGQYVKADELTTDSYFENCENICNLIIANLQSRGFWFPNAPVNGEGWSAATVNSCYSDEKWAENFLGKFASLENFRDLGNGCGVTSISVWIAVNPDDGLEYVYCSSTDCVYPTTTPAT